MSNLTPIACDAFQAIPPPRPLRGIIVGAGSVVNLLDWATMESAYHGYFDQIMMGEIVQAKLTPTWMELDYLFETIHIVQYARLNSDLLQDVEVVLEEHRPEILIFDILPDELAFLLGRSPRLVAEDIILMAERWIRHYDTNVVQIMGGIRRGACMNCSVAVYKCRMLRANAHLRRVLRHHPFIKFRPLGGFTCFPNGTPMPIHHYSANGVVAGPAVASYGFRQYRREIRGAMLEARAVWQAGHQMGYF